LRDEFPATQYIAIIVLRIERRSKILEISKADPREKNIRRYWATRDDAFPKPLYLEKVLLSKKEDMTNITINGTTWIRIQRPAIVTTCIAPLNPKIAP